MGGGGGEGGGATLSTPLHPLDQPLPSWLASNPGLPRPDFISQPWRKIGEIFLQGCEIKSVRGRSGFEDTSWKAQQCWVLTPLWGCGGAGTLNILEDDRLFLIALCACWTVSCGRLPGYRVAPPLSEVIVYTRQS